MSSKTNIQDCIIIGAGMAGLTAANLLQNNGYTTTVLDKGRGVGGRMATRRFEGALFDHGAQFFTVRSVRFAELVGDWLDQAIAVEWSRGFATSEMLDRDEGFPRYRGINGMTDIPKYLAQNLDIHLNQRVTRIEIIEGVWHVYNETNALFRSYSLLLTAPVPQSLSLLEQSSITLPDTSQEILRSLVYHPCIAVLATLDQQSLIPEPGGIQLSSEPIHWIADNQQKGISPKPSVTIHAGSHFSQSYWESDDQTIVEALFAEAGPWIGAEPIAYQVHKWRYSQPMQVFPEPYLYLEDPAPLVFAGDIFGGARVEGAFLSGYNAAERLILELL